MQSAYAIPPFQLSIHNLRTLLQLLSDEEFESEFELERQRRNSLKKNVAAVNNNNDNSNSNSRKRAPPNSAAATDTSISPKRQKKKNAASTVMLPSLLAHDAAAHDDGDDHDGGGGAPSTSANNRYGQVANNVLTDHNAATTWDLPFQELVELTHNDNDEKGETGGGAALSTSTNNRQRQVINNVVTAQNAATTWDLRFLELVEFKKQNGHCNVSDSTHKGTEWHQLATWCCNQRKNFINRQSKAKLGQKVRRKGGVMSDEHMERLAGIGFRFGPTHIDFETRILSICEYKAVHGHTRVPISYTGHGGLGRWVKKTKELYHAGKLDPARIARLKTIGMDFSRRCTPNNGATSTAAASPKKNSKTTKSSKKNQKTAPPPPPTLPPQPETAAASVAEAADGPPAQETAAPAEVPTVPAPAPQNETDLPPGTFKNPYSTGAYVEV